MSSVFWGGAAVIDDITRLYGQIDAELDDARSYATDAMQCREDKPDIAQAYIKLSGDELQHAQLLQSVVTQLMSARKRDQPLHDDVCRIADWIKSCQQERMRDIKKMHEAYQSAK